MEICSGGQTLIAHLRRKFNGLTENPRRYWVCGDCLLQPCDHCGRKYRHDMRWRTRKPRICQGIFPEHSITQHALP